MSSVTNSVNNYNNSQFRVVFNEWPNLTGKKLPSYVFDNNVRSVTIPDVSIPVLTSQTGHVRQIHPSPIGYRDLNNILITFKVDDQLLNYYAAKCWIDGSRIGKRKSNEMLPGDYLHYNRIETLEIHNLNNVGQVVSKMIFNNVFLTNISNLTLQYGQADNSEFTCTFDYMKCTFETLVEQEEN